MTGHATIVLGTGAVNTGVSVLTFSQKRAEPFAKYPSVPENAGTPLKVPCVLPVPGPYPPRQSFGHRDQTVPPPLTLTVPKPTSAPEIDAFSLNRIPIASTMSRNRATASGARWPSSSSS